MKYVMLMMRLRGRRPSIMQIYSFSSKLLRLNAQDSAYSVFFIVAEVPTTILSESWVGCKVRMGSSAGITSDAEIGPGAAIVSSL
jgi:hypothetical protein